jgi:hypothetical protein
MPPLPKPDSAIELPTSAKLARGRRGKKTKRPAVRLSFISAGAFHTSTGAAMNDVTFSRSRRSPDAAARPGRHGRLSFAGHDTPLLDGHSRRHDFAALSFISLSASCATVRLTFSTFSDYNGYFQPPKRTIHKFISHLRMLLALKKKVTR